MNTPEPQISIIMASYNYAHLIAESIESVINQTYTDWELIVIDDCSSDNSIEIIQKYSENSNKIKLITHETNKGLCETIKSGIKAAQGKYIAFLENDDYWREDCLEKRMELFEKYPDIGAIFNSVKLFGDKESIESLDYYFTRRNLILKNITWPQNINMLFFILNVVPTFSCLITTKNLLENCCFESPFKPCLDWWLWIQLSLKNEFYYLKEDLTFWRRHKSCYTERSKEEAEVALQSFLSSAYSKFCIKNLTFMKKIIYLLFTNRKYEKIFRGALRKLFEIYFPHFIIYSESRKKDKIVI